MKWFAHDTDSLRNRKLRKVIRTHGIAGYGIWFALLEKIYGAEGDFCIQADGLWLEDFADELKLTDHRTLIRIFDTFAEIALIDCQMWMGEHAIHIRAIAERGDKYISKRLYEREKKRKQREKRLNQETCPRLSPGDSLGTRGQSALLSPSYTDPDPDPDLSPPTPSRKTEQPGERIAAAPTPANFEPMRYGNAASPILEHYGLGHVATGRQGASVDFSPRLIAGLKKISQPWGDRLDSDGKAIAHARSLLSKLRQPQNYEAAIARIELAWAEGEASSTAQRKTQWEELQELYPQATGAI